ncbi:MAG: hypothetical protein GF404_06000 [candidate division Zixibacteria bacterium]|nr:hypothetical protein [candidate division Zixibacteria bacterium]
MYVYYVKNAEDDTTKYFVSPIPSDMLSENKGLPPECIMGQIIQDPQNFVPENFVQNKAFVDLLHEVIADNVNEYAPVKEEAEKQNEGYVYIIDARTKKPGVDVPQEDIIGAVEVKDGRIGEYKPSPNYVLYTSSGFMQLDQWFNERLFNVMVEHLKAWSES